MKQIDSVVKKSDPRYLIIGSGRMAQHLRFYFQSLNLNVSEWDRSQDPHQLANKIDQSTHVLLAVADQAIEKVFKKYLEGHEKITVHFSGALMIPGIYAAHPLMTFGPDHYLTDFYQKIHFVVSGANSLFEILPGLPNSYSILAEKDKAYYHALCVLGGNFTTLLSKKMTSEFQKLEIPAAAAQLYLEKIIENVFTNSDQALTGPLVRRDTVTVQKNILALDRDPYQKIYQTFIDLQWPEYFETLAKEAK